MKALPLQPISVVLIDDDPAVRHRMGAAIAADSELALVGCFAEAGSALRSMAQQMPDVLLVDLGLPDVPGLEVIEYCARQRPGMDIIVLTIFNDASNVLPCIRAGATGYLLNLNPAVTHCPQA
jgi:DNA-binding NarL/FixJ family response regulator